MIRTISRCPALRRASRARHALLALITCAAFLAPQFALAQDAPPPQDAQPVWDAWPELDPATGEAAAQDGEAAAAAVEPDRVTTPLNPQPGVYYLDYAIPNLSMKAAYPIDGAMAVLGWSRMNVDDGAYDWSDLDQIIANRKSIGLKVGMMTTVYDGTGAGDIRSTPDFVIRTPNAVLPATAKDCSTCAEYPHYINYFKKANGDFESSPHDSLWNISGGNVSIVTGMPADPDSVAKTYGAKLGGANNVNSSLWHGDLRVPAMPAVLDATRRATVDVRVYVDTADTGANDHLYIELWDTANKKIGTAGLDVTNLSQANKTWKTYTLEVSDAAPGKVVRVAFRVTTNGSNATTFWVDAVKPWVRHLIPNYHNPAFYNAYTKFIAALGQRYASSPDLQFVSYGTGVYGENLPVQNSSYPDTNFVHVVQNAGLTSALWTDYINRVTQAQISAFTTVPGQAPNRSQMVQMAPIFMLNQEREDVTDYAGTRKGGFSANFLSPDWTQALKNDGTGVYDPFVKYQGQVPLALEAYDSDLCNPVLSWLGFAQALDLKIDYLRVDTPLFRNSDGTLSSDSAGLSWAKQYVGRTPQTTPRVWTLDARASKPDYDNLSFGRRGVLQPQPRRQPLARPRQLRLLPEAGRHHRRRQNGPRDQ